MNTGDFHRAIYDLRVVISVPNQRDALILVWREEFEHFLLSANPAEQLRHFVFQLTFNPFESCNKVYAFYSKDEDTELVRAMEAEDVLKEQHARLEIRTGNDWQTIRSFKMHYTGRIYTEMDYEKINF